MADKWMDERDREDRDWRRTERQGRDGLRRYSEPRSFDRGDYEGDGGYEGGRDAVFGETDADLRYGTPNPYRGDRGRGGWQQPDYDGVSPAMRRGSYDRGRFQGANDRRGDGGGRFYGDDNRERIYAEEYGAGDLGYGGYDPGYSRTRARYHAQGYGEPGYGEDLRRDMRRPASGGTGGYDYERGYGDGGRGEARGERVERAGRHAGDFLHRAGERVANWFAGGSEARAYDPDFDGGRRGGERGARGLGPKGYKRADERISEDAHERLTDDPWLDASEITITVSAGEVMLAGSIPSREAKHRAERIVEDIPGVSHVQNNLRLSRGGVLTGDSTGYGDAVAEAQMRRDDPAANGSGGVGGGQSTAGRKN